jgi:hypothetical protein
MVAIAVRDYCVVHSIVGRFEGTQLRHLKEGDPLPYFTPSWKEKALTLLWGLSLTLTRLGHDIPLMKVFDTPIKRADRIFPLPPNKQNTLRRKINYRIKRFT